MGASLTITVEARDDLNESYAWYEERRTGLGEEFLSAVDACINAICRTPELHAILRETHRRAFVRRFPFAVYYDYLNNMVAVWAVLHTARDSQEWQERLT